MTSPLSGRHSCIDITNVKSFYYVDTGVSLENTPLVKFIRNHIRDPGGVFSISSLVKISMTSLVSSLTLKLKFVVV